MRSRSARRMVLACVVSTAAVVALVAPGAASAALVQCEGGNIHGKGSSAQKNVQTKVWTLQFNTSANAAACNGTQGSKGTPKPTYTSTGSGVGLESWGVETQVGKKNSKGEDEEEIRFGPENAFIGTEIAPNKEQEKEIESHGGGKVLTIPVLQAAVAIIVHLPKGCEKVEGGPTPGRLALKDTTVEKIFQGTDTKWSQILNKAKLVGNSECSKLAPITRVVREDGSGTTDSFMKWLDVIYKKPVLGLTETWNQLGEKTHNTVWPNEGTDPVLRGSGGGGVVAKVAEATSTGSIGYANVSDARSNAAFVPPAGGAEKATFWAEVERNTGPVYGDPATNGEVAAKGSANCGETKYTNGKRKFPPPATEELWNEVVAAKKQSTYAICYISYDLALTKYSLFTKGIVKEGNPFVENPTEGEARTVTDYLGYELSTGAGGGQPAAEGEDYAGDPSVGGPTENVLTIAQQGVSKIGF